MTLEGKVVFHDLEGGLWVFEGDDGKTYLLAGGDRKLKKAGARVSLQGDVDNASLTSAMVGPRFVVSSYRFL